MDFDYTSVNKSFLYNFLKPPLWLVSHIVYSYRCKGRKNITSDGGLIIACNHVAFSDPALILVNCPRKVYYMAKSDLFENRALAVLLKKMNAFPVRRWSADRKALKYAVDILKNGKVLGIFPEGRRVRGGAEPAEARKGVGYIARISGSDVLPCCIYKEKRRIRSKITIVFGEVIKNNELFPPERDLSSAHSAELASSISMDRIKELWLIQEKLFRQRKPPGSALE